VDITKTITHLSLCSGYEGIGIGLRSVMPNVRECAFVEIEAFNIANLVAKMEEGKIHPTPIYTNLKTFPYRKFRGCVDILSGGFPCQPFSAAGKRKATEDPRHLFPYIADGIRECQPQFVFLENVDGIISAKTTDGESVLQYVLRTLEGLDYRATAGVFSASEVGASHQRKRVYILGVSNAISSRLRGGRHSEECGDEREGILSNEGERSETEGCSYTPSEMGNAKHDGHLASKNARETSKSQKEGRLQKSQRGSDATTEMGNATMQRCQTKWDETTQQTKDVNNTMSRNVSNTNSKGLQGCGESRKLKVSQGWQGAQRHFAKNSTLFPSRPNEPQQEWEEPRVVSKYASEPKLGGTDDGSACGVDAIANRLDRLRACGNGVVPQTAAKAFLTLINRLI